MNSLGYLVACMFTSALSRRIGIKWTGIAAFASMAISGVLMYAASGYAFLSASYFLMYIGNGMLEIGLAIMAARIFTRNTGTMMNLSHFFYGLSSTVAPLVAASMMGWHLAGGELGWRGMYLIMLSLSVLPIIPSLMGKFPEETHEPEERVSYRELLRDPIAWLIVSILSFGVVSELAVGSWLVNFLTGAGIAPIYPTVMAMIAKRYPKGTDTAITFTVTLMGIASVVGNLFIGYVIDIVRAMFESQGHDDGRIRGLQAGYEFIALLALLCSACCAVLYLILRRRKEVV